MYRAGIEGILGLRLRGAVLSIDPAIPRTWPSYEAVLRHRRRAIHDHRREPEQRDAGCSGSRARRRAGVPLASVGSCIIIFDEGFNVPCSECTAGSAGTVF